MVDDGYYLNLTASAANALTSHDSRCVEVCLVRFVVHDLQEKGNQVRLMGKALASTMQVILWLSRQSEHRHLVLDFVPRSYETMMDVTNPRTPITKDSLCESPLCQHPSAQ